MSDKVEKKPFHEAIVDFINGAECLATLKDVVNLLAITEVPKNHDVIIAALDDRRLELADRDLQEVHKVCASLYQEAEQKAATQRQAPVETAEEARKSWISPGGPGRSQLN